MIGDFAFGSPMHAVDPYAYQEYFVPSSPYPLGAPSPMLRHPMVDYHIPTQAADGSFFEEAFATSPVATDVGFPFAHTPVAHYIGPQVIAEAQDIRQGARSIVKKAPRPTRQPRNRKQSQVSIGVSEVSGPEMPEINPGRKKRGRKPKTASINQDIPHLKEESEDDDDLPKDPRRRRVLERNRIAATKCRLRKRDEASALASREQAMEDQNRYLSTCFESLTAEIYHLKTQLLRHTDCNCILIQKYITNEAKKSVDSLMTCTSPLSHSHSHDIDSTSSYHQGTSNSGTSPSDSFQTTSPESDIVHPSWRNPFQPTGPLSDAGEEMFEIPMEPFREAPIVVTPGQQMACPAPFPNHGAAMYAHMSHHPQQVGNTWGWEC